MSGDWLREMMLRAVTARHSVTGVGPQMPSSHSTRCGWKRLAPLLSAPRPLRTLRCRTMISPSSAMGVRNSPYCIKKQYTRGLGRCKVLL